MGGRLTGAASLKKVKLGFRFVGLVVESCGFHGSTNLIRITILKGFQN